jgi:hypothetical protein
MEPIDTVPGVLIESVEARDGLATVAVSDGAETATVAVHERTATGGHSWAAVTMDRGRLRRFALALMRAAKLTKV